MRRQLLIAPLLLCGWLEAREKVPGNQVVFVYDQRIQVDGKALDVVVVPKDAVVALGLVPLDQQAAMPQRSIMICASYTERDGVRSVDGKNVGEFDEIGFKCGGKRYLFSKLDIH